MWFHLSADNPEAAAFEEQVAAGHRAHLTRFIQPVQRVERKKEKRKERKGRERKGSWMDV